MDGKEKSRASTGASERGSAEELDHIRRVLAVMGGKGGVVKSLVSGFVVIALCYEGHQVGILDPDTTEPSIPNMFFPEGARLGVGPMGPMPLESKAGI
jgi:Mrp family chromosome partitioning ATPase